MKYDPSEHLIEKKLVFASNNPGKLREVTQILAEARITVLPQSDFQITEVAETGLTFLENALIKARHASHHSGFSAFADDSGLVVDALNGAPGILSARYAGPGSNDTENLEKLLTDMQDVSPPERTARFVCVIVYLAHPHDPLPKVFEGIWEGRLTHAPLGSNGFGYDPIFFVPTHSRTSAQLSPEIKNAFSHRGQALRLFLANFRTRGTQ